MPDDVEHAIEFVKQVADEAAATHVLDVWWGAAIAIVVARGWRITPPE